MNNKRRFQKENYKSFLQMFIQKKKDKNEKYSHNLKRKEEIIIKNKS